MEPARHSATTRTMSSRACERSGPEKTEFHGNVFSIEGAVGIRPIQPGGPQVWVGGSVRRSVERAAQWGDGYIASSKLRIREDRPAGQPLPRRAPGARERPVHRGRRRQSPYRGRGQRVEGARELPGQYLGLGLQGYARGGALGEEGRALVNSPEGLLSASPPVTAWQELLRAGRRAGPALRRGRRGPPSRPEFMLPTSHSTSPYAPSTYLVPRSSRR